MGAKVSIKSLIFKLSLSIIDFALIAMSILLAYWIRFHSGIFQNNNALINTYLSFSIVSGIVGLLLLYYEGLFEIKKQLEKSELLLKVIKVSSLLVFIGIIISFFAKGTLISYRDVGFSRIVIVLSYFITIFFLFINHVISYEIIKIYREKGIGFKKVAIIGTGNLEIDFWNALKENIYTGYKILGFISISGKRISKNVKDHILGDVSDLKNILLDNDIDEVILSNPSVSENALLNIIGLCDKLDVKLNIIPNIYGILTYKTKISTFLNFPLISIEEKLQSKWNKFLKSSLDMLLSIIILIIAFPLFIVVTLLIKFETEGPVFFKQQRLGKGERPFYLYKFRSMIQDAEKQFHKVEHLNEAKGAIFKIKNDPRITMVGKYLRKFSIDELPQLFNVVKGDISLVGPRPSLKREAKKYKGWQLKRYNVKPGITGLAQVSGRSDLTFNQIIELDMFYMRNWSPGLDLKILLKTVKVVLRTKGAY